MNKKVLKPCTDILLKNNYYKDKTVLITGGATGLGENLTKMYEKLGANVIVCSRKIENLDKIKSDKISVYPLDVRNNDKVSDLAEYLYTNNTFPDVIINNAAGNFLCPTKHLTVKGWNSIIDIVLKGTINMTFEFGKKMIDNKLPGVFLNMSTNYANTGSSYVVPSAVAKAGCDNLVKSLASEWGPHGIRFMGVAPGPIYTEGAFSRLDPDGNFRQMLIKSLPMGRLGKKVELSNLITYLTSDYARWITGQIFTIDGGEVVYNSGSFNKIKDYL